MFTLQDIVHVAVTIEKNGEAIYRRAAGQARRPEMRDLLNSLADEEKEHVCWFEDLLERCGAVEVDPDLAAMGKNMLADAVGDAGFSLAEADFSSMENLEALFDQAGELEDDTVAFYEMLGMFVEDEATREGLNAIIAEEKSHSKKLADRKKALSSPLLGGT